MGATKKPRKKYRPGPAWATSPMVFLEKMPDAEIDRLMLVFRTALQAMAACQHPGRAEWEDLADAINVVEALVKLKAIARADAEPLVLAAKIAMRDAARRFSEGKGMRLDAEGLNAIRTALDIYEASARYFTGGTMHRASRLAASTVRKHLASGQPATIVAI